MDLNVLFFCGCEFMRSIRSGLFFRFLGFANLISNRIFFLKFSIEPESCCRLLFLTYCYKYAANPGFRALFSGTPSSVASRLLLVKCSTNGGFALETAFFGDISGTVLSEAFFYIIAPFYGDPPRKPGFSGFCWLPVFWATDYFSARWSAQVASWGLFWCVCRRLGTHTTCRLGFHTILKIDKIFCFFDFFLGFRAGPSDPPGFANAV